MGLVTSQTPVFNPATIFSAELLENEGFPATADLGAEELSYELGLWLAGLRSFLGTSNHSFAERNPIRNAERDWAKEFRLSHSVLLLCLKLNSRLCKALKDSETNRFNTGHTDEVLSVLRDAIILNGALIRAESLKFDEWKAWTALLSAKFRSAPVIDEFILNAERSGEDYVPENLRAILQNKTVSFSDRADLELLLPRFGKILKSLSVIGAMLRNDEPLKPTLLIFSTVQQQTKDLIAFINNRLARFPNEEAELFSSLDGASYTASLELKKVYQQELTGIVGVRPSPSVYARIETAYALLNDSFQQILAGFARLFEPQTTAPDLFPNFRIKLEQSLVLRERLEQVLQAVKLAEKSPDKNFVDDVKTHLTAFLSETIPFLYFKDRETLERFGEEIFAVSERKDFVPILHRFGAYLETLFSQVNMRNVLANHPFEKK